MDNLDFKKNIKNEQGFLNWQYVLSFDADTTAIITEGRRYGKTFGMRLQFIKDYLKDGSRFGVICRTKENCKTIINDYFGRVQEKGYYQDLKFKYCRGSMEIKIYNEQAEEWDTMGYFLPLSAVQAIKETTYNRVYRIVFDEFIIERMDQFHYYLAREFSLLKNVFTSVASENPNDPPKHRPHLYLLANALDIINPVFQHYGISETPEEGCTWYDDKHFLLMYIVDKDYLQARTEETVSGRFGGGDSMTLFAADNKDFIKAKPKGSHFMFGFVFKDDRFGVWIPPAHNGVYINNYIPPKTKKPIYTLLAEDGRANYIMIRKTQDLMLRIIDLHYASLLYYDSKATQFAFLRMLSLHGVR